MKGLLPFLILTPSEFIEMMNDLEDMIETPELTEVDVEALAEREQERSDV